MTALLKELVILGLVLLLLVYSILAFLNNWKKNYRDISTCVQYSHLAQQHNNSKYFLQINHAVQIPQYMAF